MSAVLLLSAVDCREIEPVVTDTDIIFTYCGYFLNAGIPGENDAEVTQLNTVQAIVNQRIFAEKNDGKTFGDDARDIHILGNKLYVSLAGSQMIRVMSKFDCTDQGTIIVQSEEDGCTLTPHSLTSFEGTLIVSYKEGYVASIDTTSLKPIMLQRVGTEPGAIAIAGQKLYVADMRDDDGPGHEVLMLNPVDLHVMKILEVAPNPTRMVTDPVLDDLYVISAGDDTTPGCLQKIDSDIDDLTVIWDAGHPVLMDASSQKSLILYVKDESVWGDGKLLVFNTETQRVEGEFIRDGSYVRHPCNIAVDTNTGNVYIADDSEGEFCIIFIYTDYGQYLTSFNSGGANTCGAVFVTGS